jgi:hypothetical protein
MATNTTLQYLETTGEDAFGASVGLGATVSNRRQVETFIASGAITAGQIVGFDTSKTGAARVQSVTPVAVIANGNGLACGVALADASVGDRVDVVVAGYVDKVNCHGAVVLGNLLTAGTGGTVGAADGRVDTDIAPAFGIALGASGLSADGYVNPAPAYIYKHF